jgi:archaellum component FlaD/FlaE
MDKPLPKLADVIRKVKKSKKLKPEDEVVYLMYIEDLREEEAIKIVSKRHEKDGVTG